MSKNGHILLVDDDPVVLRELGAMLKNEGLSVLIATDRAQALRLQQKNNVLLGLIGLQAEGDDGLQIGAALCHHDEMLRVIMVTAQPSVTGAVAAMRAGCFDYVDRRAGGGNLLASV